MVKVFLKKFNSVFLINRPTVKKLILLLAKFIGVFDEDKMTIFI
ncbi:MULTISPECIES: hypothetical protein [Campylobacter]|nr:MULTISPECIES: hypothetical protein [Campylobacter]